MNITLNLMCPDGSVQVFARTCDVEVCRAMQQLQGVCEESFGMAFEERPPVTPIRCGLPYEVKFFAHGMDIRVRVYDPHDHPLPTPMFAEIDRLYCNLLVSGPTARLIRE